MMRFVETPTLINTNATPGMTAYSTLERSHAIHYRAQAGYICIFFGFARAVFAIRTRLARAAATAAPGASKTLLYLSINYSVHT